MYLSQTIHRKRALFKTKRFFLVFIQMVAKHNQAVAMISLDRVHIFDHMIFSSKVFMHQNYWVLNVIHLKISKKGIVRLSTKSFKWVVNQEIKGKLFTHDKTSIDYLQIRPKKLQCLISVEKAYFIYKRTVNRYLE